MTVGPTRALPLGLFFAANVMFAAGLFAHAFLYNFYLAAVGLSESVMGGAAASFTAGGLVALVPAGRLVDRGGPAMAYRLAAMVAAVGLMLGAIAEQPLSVYGAGFVAGLGTSTWRVVMGPAIMQLAAGPARSRAFSWNVALLVASGALWTAASGAVPDWYQTNIGGTEEEGLRVALLLGAGLTLVAAVLLPRLLADQRRVAGSEVPVGSEGEVERDDQRAGSTRRALFAPAWLVTLIVIVTVWMMAAALVLPFLNLYFQREHGMAIARIGAIFATAQLITAAAVAASAELAARIGPRLALMAWAVLLGPALLLLGYATTPGLAITLFVIAGFVPPATNPLIDQVLLERAPRERHGEVSTWRNAATELSGLAGASLGGVLLEATSFRALFMLAAAFAVAGAVALMVRVPRLAAVPDPEPV